MLSFFKQIDPQIGIITMTALVSGIVGGGIGYTSPGYRTVYTNTVDASKKEAEKTYEDVRGACMKYIANDSNMSDKCHKQALEVSGLKVVETPPPGIESKSVCSGYPSKVISISITRREGENTTWLMLQPTAPKGYSYEWKVPCRLEGGWNEIKVGDTISIPQGQPG